MLTCARDTVVKFALNDHCLSSLPRNPSTMSSKSKSLLGIKWAPISIPFHRRVETVAMFHFWYVFILGCITSMVIIWFAFVKGYYSLLLFFFVYVYLDRKTPERGGRRWQAFREWSAFKYCAEYFPMMLHKTVDLDPSKSYLGGFHPHGIMATGVFVQFGTEGTGFSRLFPGIIPHVLTLGGWFNFPLVRDYIMMTGVCSVSRASIDYILNQPGHMALVVVGGAKESLLARPGSHQLYLLKRKGFIKRAITAGACLVPVYSFGETDMYKQVNNPNGSWLKAFQDKATKYIGFAPPLFYGRGFFNYNFGLLPNRVPVNTVVGKPIEVTKTENPSQDYIDSVHQKYMDGLSSLFEENKTKFGIDKSVHLTLL